MASMRKIFWKEYIRISKRDKELLKERNKYDNNLASDKYQELDQKVWKNLQYLNSLSATLRKLLKPKFKWYNYKLGRTLLIGKIYNRYYKINGHTFKNNGPITIIGKADRDGNVEYPNTRWYRIIKLNKFIR